MFVGLAVCWDKTASVCFSYEAEYQLKTWQTSCLLLAICITQANTSSEAVLGYMTPSSHLSLLFLFLFCLVFHEVTSCIQDTAKMYLKG